MFTRVRSERAELGRGVRIAETPGECLATTPQVAVVDRRRLAHAARLEQQCPELAGRLGPVDAGGLGCEAARLHGVRRAAPVGEYAFAEIHGLAHVEQCVALAVEAIDARGLGQFVGERRRQLRRQHGAARHVLEGAFDLRGRPARTQTAPELPQRHCVRQRAMARGARQVVIGDQRVEIVPRELRIEAPRQLHRAREARVEGAPEARELPPHEAVVEARVVRDEQAPLEPARELVRHVRKARRALERRGVDAGQVLYGGRQARAGVDQRRPGFLVALAVREHDPELHDPVIQRMPTRRLDIDERERAIEQRGHDRSSQVVFSSVYLSKACSDLSRPIPDCLKPPNGTVMSSAS